IAAAGKPVVTAVAADKPVATTMAADNWPAAAGSPPGIAPVAGSSRAAVDNRLAPGAAGNLPAADNPAAAAARWQTSRSLAARAPPVLRKLLCPYRRPRTRRGADSAPVVAGAAVRRPGSPLR